jgi:hypothetical protein
LYSPLEGSQDKTENEVDDKTRKLNMERFGFFLHEFGFDTLMIGANGWVIIIVILSRNFRCRSSEMAL